MHASSSMAAIRALQMELKSLQSQPVEGFKVTADDDNLFKWTVAIFGPPGTLYQVYNLKYLQSIICEGCLLQSDADIPIKLSIFSTYNAIHPSCLSSKCLSGSLQNI
jgi:hypothetical protein